MAYGTRAAFEPVREVAFGSIGATYATFGSTLTDHARIIRFVNGTDAQVYISLDGTNDHIRMAANSFFLLDFSTNRIRDDGLFIKIGTQFYQRRVSGAPTTGSLWMEIIYGEGGV